MSQTKLISLDNLTRYDGKIKELIHSETGNTTYTLSVGTGADASKIVLTDSDGNEDKVTVPYATNAGTVNSHTVATDVPANAVFTDTTYSDATTSASGLMSASDKTTINSLGTAAFRDIPTSGDASNSEVVLGADSRLSDARPASDVSSWAKASTKPTYTASEVGAIASTAKGANNGVAELDNTGKVPSSQLPSYVDDVLEYNSSSDFPLTGESGKIYIAKDTNKTYRWSGTSYVEISESLALGETASTAYAGNKGKANAYAIAAIKDGSTIDSFGDVETALSDKVDKVSGKGLSTNDYTTTEKNKLSNIADGAEVNVQSDWTQTDNSKDDFIKNKPTLGTASAKDIPASGNASTTQVVMGNDTRLTDSRPASDVSAWAKESTKPSYTASEVGAEPSGGTTTGNKTFYVGDKLYFKTDGEGGNIIIKSPTNIAYEADAYNGTFRFRTTRSGTGKSITWDGLEAISLNDLKKYKVDGKLIAYTGSGNTTINVSNVTNIATLSVGNYQDAAIFMIYKESETSIFIQKLTGSSTLSLAYSESNKLILQNANPAGGYAMLTYSTSV